MDGQSATGIIGRERELTEVAAALSDRLGRGVALAGPAGVGKSRLAAEALIIAEAEGALCLTAIATPASQSLTLGALTHLLPPAGELADLHDELRPAQLLRATQQSLREEAGDRALVLAIDDAHLLDPVSAHLVGQLAANGTARVVLTVRTGEPAPEGVTALWKDGLVRRIDLEAFSQSTTASFAGSLLGAPVDTQTARWLQRTSAGNALFARELVLGARDTGGLVRRGAVWGMAVGTPPVSPRLSDLVEQRLAGLSPAGRRALDLVAMAEPLGLDLAMQIVGEEPLSRLDEHGLLQVVIAGSRVELRPAHPLYGEALRQQPMTLRRRGDLLALIKAVRAHGARRRDDRVRLALWQLAAGEGADPEVLLRAAVGAQQGLDNHEAIRLAELGLRQRAVSADVTAELRVCAATSFGRIARFGEADELLALAEADEPDEDRRNRIAVRRAFVRFEGADDLDGAEQVLRLAHDRSLGEAWRDRLELTRATVLADGGRSADAAELMASRVAVPVDADVVIAFHLAHAASAIGAGDWSGAVRHASTGYDFHVAHPDADSVYHPISQLWYRFVARRRGGWRHEATADLELMVADSERDVRPIAEIVCRALQARVLIDEGRLDEASKVAAEAVDRCAGSVQPYLHRWSNAVLVWAEAARGAVDLAADAAQRSAAAGPQPPTHGMGAALGRVEVVMAGVALAHAENRVAAARAALDHGIELAEADGDVASAAELMVFACTLFGQRATGERLRRTAGVLDPAAPMAAAASTLGRAVAQGSHEGLAAAAGAFAELGHAWTAAHLWRAAAERAGAQGQSRAAAAHGRRERELLDSCTGLLVVPGAPSGGLTDRELEIAALVAAGRTSREVAAELVVSVRTIDNHLQRIYAKLGVTSRRDLRDALTGLGR